MDRRGALKTLAGFVLCPICAPEGFAAEGAHWSYGGATGPDKWGDLDPGDRVCAVGSQESPVDISEPIKSQLSPLQISWNKDADTIVNNGHTIQVNCAKGSTLAVGKEKYTLVQFHFHRPSEHHINGKNFPMEAHFVHANAAGLLAVIGVLMIAGGANPVFNKIVSIMPPTVGPPLKADGAIDPNGLLPTKRSYYAYEGSLTTPPCSEVVNWLLLTEPIQVADTDIESFAKLYSMNARPVQKLNRRFVLQSG